MVEKMSRLDQLLPAWIGIAMAVGLLLGRLVPGLNAALNHVQVDGISLPIALGLLVMMYPVLAKVRYDRLDTVTGDRKLLASSLVLNWLVGPALMFALAWLLLPDLPDYRTGLIIVGLARCIAMVIIWNDLACGDREAAAVLVALNSIFQVVMFAALGWFYLSVLPGWLGLPQSTISTSPWQIAKSVLVFLGIPLLAGYLTRRFGENAKGRSWYESNVPAQNRAVGALRPAVHHRHSLCPARTSDHQSASRRGPHRSAAAGLLRRHVGRRLPPGRGPRTGIPAHHHPRVHRCGQQLRTSHRRVHRDLRCRLGTGTRRCRRPAHRSPGPGRPRLRIACPRKTIRSCCPRKRCVMPNTQPAVLFLCTHNAGRSQMAMGFFKHFAGDHASVYSGGSEPAAEVNSAAIAAMAEKGIDIAAEQPKRWTMDMLEAVDVVITMGCADSCPVLPGRRYEEWVLPDPAGQPLDAIYGRSVTKSNSEYAHLLSQLGVPDGRSAN